MPDCFAPLAVIFHLSLRASLFRPAKQSPLSPPRGNARPLRRFAPRGDKVWGHCEPRLFAWRSSPAFYPRVVTARSSFRFRSSLRGFLAATRLGRTEEGVTARSYFRLRSSPFGLLRASSPRNDKRKVSLRARSLVCEAVSFFFHHPVPRRTRGMRETAALVTNKKPSRYHRGVSPSTWFRAPDSLNHAVNRRNAPASCNRSGLKRGARMFNRSRSPALQGISSPVRYDRSRRRSSQSLSYTLSPPHTGMHHQSRA